MPGPMLGKELDAVPEVKDALTEMLLDRMRRTGSLLEDEAATEEDRLTLFDDE